MRFERKFRIEGFSLAEVKQMLRFHPASFRPLYPDRQINNIYFDTPNLLTFHLNVAGVGQRKKYRVRWYGEDVAIADNPRFEIKIKQNELGAKEIFGVKPFTLENLTEITREVNRLHGMDHRLEPVLLNSYHRAYFGSLDGRFRLTIDWDLRYHSMRFTRHFSRYLISDPALVVEIKYDEENDYLANGVTQFLPFRQSKHSKYVQGVQMVQ